jgi:peptidoglycan/xylan/chitin deacetylase (PgdA/CDA1 family)
MAKEIFVAFGIDVDAVGGWLGSYGGEVTRRHLAWRVRRRGRRAAPQPASGALRPARHLVLARSLDRDLPEQFDAVVVASGHEIGLHGYSHENPIAMTREQESEILDHCIDLISSRTGKRPTGYVAPWWEFSTVTNELLVERGIKYDHSLMHRDFEPYYVRVGDSWTPIDYDKPAAEWMKPFVRGEETDLVEIPASWYLDDLPPMMFIKGSPNSHGFVNPRHIEEIWRDQFDWVYREYDYAVFTFTIHPDVSGRPQVQLMLERLIDHISSHDGITWANFDTIAEDFKKRHPAPDHGSQGITDNRP